MEVPVSRMPSWVHALIAEAKRRARRRRLLVLLLVLVVAGASAAVALRPSGGGSPSSGPAGRLGSSASGSRSLRFGAFVLTVPKGFHRFVAWNGSIHKRTLGAFWIAHDPRAISTGLLLPERGVFLSVQGHTGTPSSSQRLPLDLHKLYRDPPLRHGTMWQDTIYGGDEGYLIMVFEGDKASAADRAAIAGAIRSIRRAS